MDEGAIALPLRCARGYRFLSQYIAGGRRVAAASQSGIFRAYRVGNNWLL